MVTIPTDDEIVSPAIGETSAVTPATTTVEPEVGLGTSDEEVAPATTTVTADPSAEFTWPDFPKAVQMQSPRFTGILPLQESTIENYRELLKMSLIELGEAEFFSRAMVPGSRENLLVFFDNNFSAHAAKTRDELKNVVREKLDTKITDENGTPIFGSGPRRVQASGGGKFVSGEAGATAFHLRHRGNVRRQVLYNSGFSVDLRCPTADELATVVNRAKAETEEYGRLLGAHFYSQAHLLVQEALVDYITRELVIYSDLKHWDQREELRSHIKLPDLDALIWATAALVYPDGYSGFRHVCARPVSDEHPHGCNCVTEIDKISLGALLKNNYQIVPSGAIDHLLAGRHDPNYVYTKSSLEKYHSSLGFDGQKLRFENLEITLKVPSVDEYLRHGKLFISELINEYPANRLDLINPAVHFKFSQQLIPYVASIAAIAEDGSIDVATTDTRIIRQQLGRIDTRDEVFRFRKELADFAYASKISHVVYPAFACPTCGYLDEENKGFFSVDPTSTFFTLALRKLTMS